MEVGETKTLVWQQALKKKHIFTENVAKCDYGKKKDLEKQSIQLANSLKKIR